MCIWAYLICSYFGRSSPLASSVCKEQQKTQHKAAATPFMPETFGVTGVTYTIISQRTQKKVTFESARDVYKRIARIRVFK